MTRLLKIILPLTGKLGFAKYLLLGLFSGLLNFLFLNCITRVVSLIVAGKYTSISKEYILIFLSVILLFIWNRRTLSLGVIRLSQTIFWTLRRQIINAILKANYQQLASRKIKVHASILNDVHTLTDASINIITFSTSFILAVCCLVYLASISLTLFLITFATALLGVVVYYLGSRKNNEQFIQTRKLENNFLEKFNSILNGFKEIYMEPRKGRSIYDHKIDTIAHDAYQHNIRAFTGFLNNQITGQVLFYVLISSVLLFLSVALNIRISNTVSFVFTLLYLLGAIETIMVLLPGLMRARIAARHLMDLKEELEEANFNNPIPSTFLQSDDFDRINVKELEFSYESDDKPFSIGPVDMEIGKGEIVFIFGGNGSGKTTLVNALLGLCVPAAGEIQLNGVKVANHNYPVYRTLFAVVFSDFYLFNDLHWLQQLDQEKWDYYIRLFELEGKITITDRTFSTTDLSAGQRKRLALIAALMEDKPILVLDEWAADQDPYFRKKFYTEVLPELKRGGITIIAITHDDKYYHCADRLYKMDYGKLTEEQVDAPLINIQQ